MILGLNVLGSNNWLQFLSAVVIVGGVAWGVIAGAVMFWHKHQVRALAENIKPMLDSQNEQIAEVRNSIRHVVEMLTAVKHEVEYNNGSSVKDALRRVENTLKKSDVVQHETSEKIDKITSDLSYHLGQHDGVDK